MVIATFARSRRNDLPLLMQQTQSKKGPNEHQRAKHDSRSGLIEGNLPDRAMGRDRYWE